MSIQSEAVLEKQLIKQLNEQGFGNVIIKDEDALNSNFRNQLEKHNKIEFTDIEFNRILIYLDGGSVFEKAKKLRGKYCVERENGDVYIEFLNIKEWCKNLFQVTNQVTMIGKYENRYDVTGVRPIAVRLRNFIDICNLK